MKYYSKLVAGVILQIWAGGFLFAQTKVPKDSLPPYAQIMPKFSEMTDYISPVVDGIQELPSGKAPASNQLNADGSIKVNRTGEIIVPATTPDVMKIKRQKDLPGPVKKVIKK
ncbi:hypothetical protein L0657_00530 [Dyadobacter sp. CY345]|uniref:hypothetical protein n=1 Tax=Dyadobacter sp. CY345 TaxID=2909335 RepID=UPI001F16A29A|nr:hypothetical protein [Dyadobacter sp. CY345]MCF2442420.1 hypothetical protein [Dyadobacter sp. CY345]